MSIKVIRHTEPAPAHEGSGNWTVGMSIHFDSRESFDQFRELVDRALNCWDDAPAELKELGDMLTHGYITQHHERQPMNTVQNPEYYTAEEQGKIKQYIASFGFDAWFRRLRIGQVGEVLNGTAKD